MEWISTKDRLPEVKDKAYQVLAIANKEYDEGSNYEGEGKKGVVQDWVVRMWDENFSHLNMIQLYPSVVVAADSCGINYSTLVSKLNGRLKNNTGLKYDN